MLSTVAVLLYGNSVWNGSHFQIIVRFMHLGISRNLYDLIISFWYVEFQDFPPPSISINFVYVSTNAQLALKQNKGYRVDRFIVYRVP